MKISNVLYFDRVSIIKDEKDFIYDEKLDLYNISLSNDKYLNLTYLLPYSMGFNMPIKYNLFYIWIKPFSLINNSEIKVNKENYLYFKSLDLKGYKIKLSDEKN